MPPAIFYHESRYHSIAVMSNAHVSASLPRLCRSSMRRTLVQVSLLQISGRVLQRSIKILSSLKQLGADASNAVSNLEACHYQLASSFVDKMWSSRPLDRRSCHILRSAFVLGLCRMLLRYRGRVSAVRSSSACHCRPVCSEANQESNPGAVEFDNTELSSHTSRVLKQGISPCS